MKHFGQLTSSESMKQSQLRAASIKCPHFNVDWPECGRIARQSKTCLLQVLTITSPLTAATSQLSSSKSIATVSQGDPGRCRDLRAFRNGSCRLNKNPLFGPSVPYYSQVSLISLNEQFWKSSLANQTTSHQAKWLASHSVSQQDQTQEQ
jgi:hypothetical protein